MYGIIRQKIVKKNSAPLIHAEVRDVFYTATHAIHNQCFEMLRAKESINFWYASSLQVRQNLVGISFSPQHPLSVFPRRNFDGMLLIVCCANKYLSRGSVSNTLGERYFKWSRRCSIRCERIFYSLRGRLVVEQKGPGISTIGCTGVEDSHGPFLEKMGLVAR